MPEVAVVSPKDVLSPAEKTKLLKVKANRSEFPQKEPFKQGIIDDEFSPKLGIPILKPLEIDYQLRGIPDYQARDVKATLDRDYEYYSKTRELEVDTPRTKVLQEVVDKMTIGSNIQTRVVIMNKTGQVNAFVCPDGTIFVTQALLNKLDTLDEVAAVLGHEVGHLINKTHSRVMNTNQVTAPGVSWVHEAGCDVVARPLMEKAGYNTLEFASGIEKAGGFERDFAHQSGLMRASTSVGGHFFVDSTTAHLKPIPIEDPTDPVRSSLHKEFRKSNLEQAREILIKNAEVKSARTILERLHPADLYTINLELFGNRANGEKPTHRYAYLKELNSLIAERLMHLGYQPVDISLMIISNSETPYGSAVGIQVPEEDCYLFNTVDTFEKAIQRLPQFEIGTLKREMMKAVFTDRAKVASPTLRMLSLMSKFIYNFEQNPEYKGIPVTEKSLLDTLKLISEIRSSEFYEFEVNKRKSITYVLTSYIDTNFVPSSVGGQEKLDTDKLVHFLTQVKEMGIEFDSDAFMKRYYKKLKKGSENKLGIETIKREIFNTYLKVFNIEFSEEQFSFQDIDHFFETQGFEGGVDKITADSFISLLKKIQRNFTDDEIFDENGKAEYVEYILNKIDSTGMPRVKPILDELNGSVWKTSLDWEKSTKVEESPEFLEAVRKFSLKTIAIGSLFDSDGERYYKAMGESMNQLIRVMEEQKIDFHTLSKVQLINLCANFFKAGYYGQKPTYIGYSSIVEAGDDKGDLISYLEPENLPRLFELPLIKQALEKDDIFDVSDIVRLTERIDGYLSRFVYPKLKRGDDFSLYQDTPLGLLLGPPIAASFDKLLQKGVDITEYDSLYTFVKRFFSPGVQKNEILRGINQQYLNSESVGFDEKVDYLIKNLDSVGYEGVSTVVEQIKDINTYRQFRQRMSQKLDSYLDGTATVTKVATTDFLSSKLTDQFEELLETCKVGSSGSISTKLARQWIDKVNSSYGNEYAKYDSDSQRFVLTELSRGSFRTVADIFSQLQELTPIQRFAISHKALMDVAGAFSSPERRQVLANVLVSSLGLEPGFIADVLAAAATDGDAKYIGFPASSMVSSMLFTALNIDSVDIGSLENDSFYRRGQFTHIQGKDLFSGVNLETILGSHTRDIILFGANAKKDPNSEIARRADLSDQFYYSTLEQLNGMMVKRPDKKIESPNKEDTIDPANEAVIRAVQASGALGVRALQLASQFHRFSPAVDRRLSEAFDANPGMDRVRFWENLNKLTTDEPGNQELERFLQSIELGDFLGGGSLQTTFAATLNTENGQKRNIIIKRKNPAVLGLLGKTYETADNILRVVGSKKGGSRESKRFARTASMLIDLSQSWCIADINDKTYSEDDDQFRHTVEGFNQSGNSQVSFYAPERVFTQNAIKSEDQVEGRTINQVLKDNAVDDETKKNLVQAMGQFFLYQLRGNSFQDQDGKPYFLVHSDPHIGNYMADVKPESTDLKIGVIDRSLYLKLSEKEVRTMEKLIKGTNPNDFVYSFVELVLDENKDRGLERVKTTAAVFVALAKEYRSQMVGGKMDKFALLQTLMSELTNQKKDIPLRLRLMIRNIGALQELTKRYGLDLANL